jgi:hypothetical protein
MEVAKFSETKKAKQVQSNVKNMLIMFFNSCEVVHRKEVLQGQTVNHHFYLSS